MSERDDYAEPGPPAPLVPTGVLEWTVPLVAVGVAIAVAFVLSWLPVLR